MQRIVGVVLPDEKRIDFALTKIYGIGWSYSHKVLDETNVSKETRVKDLKDEDVKKIVNYIEKNIRVEGDLREIVRDNMKRHREINSYRGMRHKQGLPVRGQRTRSNARTKRGRRQTVGALSKEAWAKLDQQK